MVKIGDVVRVKGFPALATVVRVAESGYVGHQRLVLDVTYQGSLPDWDHATPHIWVMYDFEVEAAEPVSELGSERR
jgi:hypothetical protein